MHILNLLFDFYDIYLENVFKIEIKDNILFNVMMQQFEFKHFLYFSNLVVKLRKRFNWTIQDAITMRSITNVSP